MAMGRNLEGFREYLKTEHEVEVAEEGENLVVEILKVNVLTIDAANGVMAGHAKYLHDSCPVCGNKAYQTEKEGANH